MNEEMNFVVGEAVELDDGAYEGVIIDIEERQIKKETGEVKYAYLDVVVKESKTGFTLKYGCAKPKEKLLPNSRLGRLLLEFTDLKPHINIDIRKVLLNNVVSFLINNVKKKDSKKYYPAICEDSIKFVRQMPPSSFSPSFFGDNIDIDNIIR